MNAEQYKILAGILALKSFTGAELATATGVNSSTVSSWLQRKARKGEFIVAAGRTKSTAGRPRNIWKLQDNAAEQIRSIVANIDPDTRSNAVTAKEAALAFEDPDIRLMIRRHLLFASRAEGLDERSEELTMAEGWLAHEKERLEEWIEDGFSCPQDITKEIETLEMWMQGLELKVDRLGIDGRGWAVERFSDWMTEAIGAWFLDATVDRSDLFAPLSLDIRPDLDLRESLVRQLMIMMRTAEHVATVPLDRLLAALLMTYARIETHAARDAVCDIFETIGFDRIGQTLQHRMETAHDSPRERRFIIHVLHTLKSYPQLLQNKEVGAWFDALPYSRLWVPCYANHFFMGLNHRPNADPMRALRDKEFELRLCREKLEARDENWLAELQGLRIDIPATVSRIGRILADLATVQKTPQDDIAASWTQRYSAVAV